MDNCEEMNNSMDLVSEIDSCDLPIKNIGYLSEYINEINKDNISDIQYDKSKFEKGISKMSKICGMITALVNVGITPDNALAYISEYELNSLISTEGSSVYYNFFIKDKEDENGNKIK